MQPFLSSSIAQQGQPVWLERFPMRFRTATFLIAVLGALISPPASAREPSIVADASASMAPRLYAQQAVYKPARDARRKTHKESEVNELLAELDRWMRAHRADLYARLNPPATDAQLSELEAEAGMPLPEDFKALLRWKNGQPDDVLDTFHPLTNEMFVSTAFMISSMREMKSLARYEDIDPRSWSQAWVPFMDNGGGNQSCLDLKTGAIVFRDHETQKIDRTHASLRDWLRELVRELATNNFAEWDFKESRGPS
jgi:cell wall assembly regulator SMI1